LVSFRLDSSVNTTKGFYYPPELKLLSEPDENYITMYSNNSNGFSGTFKFSMDIDPENVSSFVLRVKWKGDAIQDQVSMVTC
jgi:hypothetical protein